MDLMSQPMDVNVCINESMNASTTASMIESMNASAIWSTVSGGNVNIPRLTHACSGAGYEKLEAPIQG